MSKVKTQLIIEGKNNASKAIDAASKSLSGLEKSAIKFGAALAGAFSVNAVVDWTKAAIDAADAASKSAAATGTTVEAYTALAYAADLAGVSTGELDAALSKFNRTIDGAARGGATESEVFERLGVAATDAQGAIRSTTDVIADVADKFQALPDGAQKSALAMDLFGRSGARLIPLLNQGAAGINEVMKEAEALGLVLSSEQAAASEVFNDNLTQLGAVSDGVANKMAAQLLPTLISITDGMFEAAKNTQVFEKTAEVLGNIFKGLVAAGIAVGTTFANLGRTIGGAAAAAVSVAQGEFKQAGEIMKDVARENAEVTELAEKMIGDLWSDTGEKIADEQKKRVMGMQRYAGDLNTIRTQIVADAEKAIKAEADAVKAAQKEVEKARSAQLKTEERYKEAIEKLREGPKQADVPPSFRDAFLAKGQASQALSQGDTEQAKKKAQEALAILLQLQEAGAQTYGFAGIAADLQAIEVEADQINLDSVTASAEAAQIRLDQLKADFKEIKETEITPTLDEAQLQAVQSQLEAFAEQMALELTIPVTIAPTTASGAEPEGFATGGYIRGPGTGTSDSIPALLSNGEYVIRAAAVKKLGRNYLDAINHGVRAPRFADGGMVESVAGMGQSFPSLGSLTLDIGGTQTTIYADPAQALDLQRLAAKLGRTRR